jgi:hypothetical protein
MPYETDQRLRSYLNTNQEKREQMCMALLALDKRFSELRPRHPRGGPDGGRDIEGKFNDSLLTFGAVGFHVNANDSPADKTAAKKKFRDDLASALACIPRPEVFVFFTNVELTIGERDELKSLANTNSIKECLIYHRELMRYVLDSTNGLAIRFQYLDLRLSDEEQATFFQAWGSDIHSLISTKIGDVDRKLNRILFLQESSMPLKRVTVLFNLKKSYSTQEIGHFRLFCSL